jgi:mannose-6-phosphate isomerase-like protein (cupin superfamily)
MKTALTLTVALFATILLNAQGAQPARGRGAAPAPPKPLTEPVFIDHVKVAESLAKGGNLVTAPDMIVLGSHREVPGQVEVHDKESDVIYVVDGSATFVTGGTMVNGKVSRANQWLGTEITGGHAQHLVKGDVIVVPAGIPHWFKEVTPQITYYVVKVVKP